jgi:hypothetical protein
MTLKNIGGSYGRWANIPGYVGPTYWTSVSEYNSAGTWYASQPAMMDTERDGATHVLAVDQVFYTGGSGASWDYTQPRYVINHRDPKSIARPAWQNILYGDGHVDALTAANYTQDISSSDWNLFHSTKASDYGGLFYWGGSTTPPAPPEATNPAPPPPPAAPGTPPPTPPTTPTTPAPPPPPPPPPPVNPPPLPGF